MEKGVDHADERMDGGQGQGSRRCHASLKMSFMTSFGCHISTTRVSRSFNSQASTMATESERLLQRWNLRGRSYVVTGGSKGIGLATVKALLTHGAATVIFCSRSRPDEIVNQLQADYSTESKIVHVSCDLTTSEGRKLLVESAKKHVSSLHGLVNNLG